MLRIPPDHRPDIGELLSEKFDCDSEIPAAKTVVICSAPRTGSYELCRYCVAAGVGVPHEYFHPRHAAALGGRLGIAEPLSPENISSYIELLRKRRSQNGVFAINVQYWQFSRAVLEAVGERLFEDAFVVHLFRPNIAAQVRSFRNAANTGRWDFSSYEGGISGEPHAADSAAEAEQFVKDTQFIVEEDSGFRRLFSLAGIDPYFVTMDELFRAPQKIVREIAGAVGVAVNESALDAMIALGRPYQRPDAPDAPGTDLKRALRAKLFGK